MRAEQLIAAEAALQEVSALCGVARRFTLLRQRTDLEFLPQLFALGSRLRHALRTARLDDVTIDLAAHEIMALGATLRLELERMRSSSLWQRITAAIREPRQPHLAALLPELLAEVRAVRPDVPLYFPVSPSRQHRAQGRGPFVSAVECADRIEEALATGIGTDPGGREWWDTDLPCITCGDAPTAFDTPITLCLDPAHLRVAVFAVLREPIFRIFALRLQAPMSVTLAAEDSDTWWEAYDEPYHRFRDAVANELAARGHVVSIGPEPRVTLA